MVYDLPNIYTLPIELGVAFMILLMDKRSRKLERESILRGQQLEIRQREAQQLQMERFSNYFQENSKHQVMMLESIMGVLGADQRDEFTKQVSTRYKEEIRKDIDELEDLLHKKELSKEKIDNKLDNEIDSKIDEIESAQEIASSFFPPNLIERIKKVSNTAKNSFSQLQKLADLGEFDIDLNEFDEPRVNIKGKPEDIDAKPLEEFHIEKDKLTKEMEDLRTEIQNTIEDTKSQISSQIANLFSPKNFEKGLKDMLKRDKDKSKDTDEDK